jgi:hypothetical protein
LLSGVVASDETWIGGKPSNMAAETPKRDDEIDALELVRAMLHISPEDAAEVGKAPRNKWSGKTASA